MAKQKLAGAGDWGLRGALLQMFHPLLVESIPQVGNLHPMTPGSVIVASAGSWSQLPHTDVATHPGVLPPKDGDISGCHLSSFLCLSEEYQVQVKAGTALGEAGEVRWDTIQLQRGDMLLMEATNRHHGMPALPDAKDGLQGALFNLWTPTAKYRHHQPNTTHLDPPPRARHTTSSTPCGGMSSHGSFLGPLTLCAFVRDFFCRFGVSGGALAPEPADMATWIALFRASSSSTTSSEFSNWSSKSSERCLFSGRCQSVRSSSNLEIRGFHSVFNNSSNLLFCYFCVA